MIRKNIDWEMKPQVKKGNIGERVILDFLENHGCVCYYPVTGRSHIFDLLVAKGKRTIFVAEIKTKARMNVLPYQTGFNTKSLIEYQTIAKKHNLDVFVFFVDEHPSEGRIYGNTIAELVKPCVVDGVAFPREICRGKITLFPLAKMIEIATLSTNIVEKLKANSTRKYKYL